MSPLSLALILAMGAQAVNDGSAPPPTVHELTEAEIAQRQYAWRAISVCPLMSTTVVAVERRSTTLCVAGPLNSDLERLVSDDALKGVDAVVVTSPGGYWISAYRLGERLRAADITLVTYRECFSACASILVPMARRKIIFDLTRFGFHGGIPPANLAPSLHPDFPPARIAEMQKNLTTVRDGLAALKIDPNIGADVPDEQNIYASGGASVMWRPTRKAYEGWGVSGVLYYAPSGRPE